MPDLETLKSYLVSLGFAIDNPTLEKFRRTITDLTKQIEGHTSGITKAYVGAAGTIVSAVTMIGVATVGLMDKIAQADLGYQKYAMRMYMSADAAKRLKIITDAMGESLEDIRWHPELYGRFIELLKRTEGIGPPREEFQRSMKIIRGITQEFTLLRIQATYALQWIALHLGRFLGKDIKSLKEAMVWINNWISTHMEEWTKKVAKFLYTVITLGRAAVRPFTDLYKLFSTVWEHLNKIGKALTK